MEHITTISNIHDICKDILLYITDGAEKEYEIEKEIEKEKKTVFNNILGDALLAFFLKRNKRHELTNGLKLWISAIENTTDVEDLIAIIKSMRNKAELNLRNNLFNVRDKIRELEISYRTLDTFFQGARHGDNYIDYLTIININKHALADMDSDDATSICKELEWNYDVLSLKRNYSILVLPGYLGNAETVRMWAKIAYENKVLLVTDFKDCPNIEVLKEEVEKNSPQGKDVFMANAVITCDYFRAREKSEIAEEYDDIYIPSSATLAGYMAYLDDYPIAETIHGSVFKDDMDNATHSRLCIERYPTIFRELQERGLTCIYKCSARKWAYINRTLYNGEMKVLHEYPNVRVIDWIGKLLIQIINDHCGEYWSNNLKKWVEEDIQLNLNECKGILFDSYDDLTIVQDNNGISIYIELRLLHGERCRLKLHAHVSAFGYEWEQNVS